MVLLAGAAGNTTDRTDVRALSAVSQSTTT